MSDTQTQAAPAPAAQAPQPAPATVNVPTDLNQRLAATPAAPQAPQAPQDQTPSVEISLDDIKDPVQKSIVQKHLEAKLKEANEKIRKTFGEIGNEKARLMREAEEAKKQLDNFKNKRFSPQDVQELINRPDFVQAVQSYEQQMPPQGWQKSPEDWSALSDNDKQMVAQALAESRATRAQLNQMQMSSLHTELRTAYPDYNMAEIEEVINRANSGQMSQKEIFELTYKARKFDDKVKEAYRLGWEDRNKNIGERVNGASYSNGIQTTPSEQPLERKPNEPTRSFFKRIAERNLGKITQ